MLDYQPLINPKNPVEILEVSCLHPSASVMDYTVNDGYVEVRSLQNCKLLELVLPPGEFIYIGDVWAFCQNLD